MAVRNDAHCLCTHRRLYVGISLLSHPEAPVDEQAVLDGEDARVQEDARQFEQQSP